MSKTYTAPDGRTCTADGSLLDVTLLAAVAALSSLRLPAVRVNDDGNVVPAGDDAEDGDTEGAADGMAVDDAQQPAARYYPHDPHSHGLT